MCCLQWLEAELQRFENEVDANFSADEYNFFPLVPILSNKYLITSG